MIEAHHYWFLQIPESFNLLKATVNKVTCRRRLNLLTSRYHGSI
jgi:hypothetical protein